MWTYIITAVIVAIAALCLFRHKFENGNIQLLTFFVLIGTTLITSVLVNVLRMDKFETHTVLTGHKYLIQQTISHNTTYTINTVLQKGKEGSVTQSKTVKTKPVSGEFTMNLIPIKSIFDVDKNKTRLFVLGADDKTYEVDKETPIIADKVDRIYYYATEYLGDAWTTSFSMPYKNRWSELHVKQKYIDELVDKYPFIAKTWKLKHS